ncbi:MAG: hypothetical protein LC803_07030 [Acidobacteria bacterium]|nr:hypothetical protein [Acidobacteriota bacterium]
MAMQQSDRTPTLIRSERVDDLTAQVQSLERKHGFWESAEVWLTAIAVSVPLVLYPFAIAPLFFVALSAIAPAMVFAAIWMIKRRGKEVNALQAALIRAKDEQLAHELKDKELQIGEQAERLLALEKEIAEARTKQAEAESRLEEFRKVQIRNKVGRWGYTSPLGEFLKGKPKGSAEVIFIPEDDEAFKTAMAIEGELSAGGGWRIVRNARPYSESDIIPKFSTPEMKKNVFNLPLLSRVGGLSDITVVMSPEDLQESAFPREGTAAHALYFGLISCGFEPLNNIDNRLPSGTMRVVVGAKQ